MEKYLIFAYQGNPEIYRWHLVEDKNAWQEISSLVKWLENDTLTIEIFQIEEVSPDDLLESPIYRFHVFHLHISESDISFFFLLFENLMYFELIVQIFECISSFFPCINRRWS